MKKFLIIGYDIEKIHDKIISLHSELNGKSGILSIGLKEYHIDNCEVLKMSSERLLLSKRELENVFRKFDQVFIEGYIWGDISEELLMNHFQNFNIVRV